MLSRLEKQHPGPWKTYHGKKDSWKNLQGKTPRNLHPAGNAETPVPATFASSAV
jgi:hypothetical protein